MKLKRAFCLLSILLAATAISSAVTINAAVDGCTTCVGLASMTPGSTVALAVLSVSPAQLTLGAGTYIITDAAPYSAWNYDNLASAGWEWAFGIADATGKVLLEDYIGTAPGTLATFTSQAAVAGQIYHGNLLPAAATPLSGETSIALFSDTLTLTSTTTLNFFVLDGYVGDNLGGMTLNVDSTTPEPAIPLLIGTGLAALALYRRKRQSRVG
jgi:hypothetical protein